MAQSATAVESVNLGDGYSLDCSGALPVLSLERQITVDNEGKTSGTTTATSHLLNGRTGMVETDGPDAFELPGTYQHQWTLPNATTYGLLFKAGAADPEMGVGNSWERKSFVVPDQCPGYDYSSAPLELEASDVAVDTTNANTAAVSFSYAKNSELPAWDQKPGANDLRVYIAPPGTRDWIVLEDLAVTTAGTYNKSFELAPGNYELSLGSWPVTGCIDCGAPDPTIFSVTPFTVSGRQASPTPTPTPTESALPTAAPTATPADAGSALSAQLSRNVAAPGSELTVTASGFAANEPLEIWLHSTPVKLATTTADATGSLSQAVVIPVDTAAGSHRIEVRGANSGTVFVNLTVADGLAATGADGTTAPAALAAGALVLVGGTIAFLVMQRRRPRTVS